MAVCTDENNVFGTGCNFTLNFSSTKRRMFSMEYSTFWSENHEIVMISWIGKIQTDKRNTQYFHYGQLHVNVVWVFPLCKKKKTNIKLFICFPVNFINWYTKSNNNTEKTEQNTIIFSQ